VSLGQSRKGRVVAISISDRRGIPKRNVEVAQIVEDYGISGDAHGGTKRQVSLLAMESIMKMIEKGAKVKPGDFAENITTQGVNLSKVKIGSKIGIGDSVLLEVTHIGKVCHSRCRIYYSVGDCIMPREGIFARVLKGGKIRVGDKVEVYQDD